MRELYQMIRDAKGERGGFLYSPQRFKLNTKFGDKLVAQGKAIKNPAPKRMVRLYSEGKMEELSWSDYLKRYKRK